MLQTFKNMELYALGTAPPNEPTPLDEVLELRLYPDAQGNVRGIPARIQIRLVRLVKLLRNEVGTLTETRNKYIRLYGEDKGNGNFIITGPNDEGKPVSPGFGKYKEEMEDLLGQSTKLDFEKVVLPANVEISGKLLLDFEAFIEIAEEEPLSDNGRNTEPVLLKRVE